MTLGGLNAQRQMDRYSPLGEVNGGGAGLPHGRMEAHARVSKRQSFPRLALAIARRKGYTSGGRRSRRAS